MKKIFGNFVNETQCGVREAGSSVDSGFTVKVGLEERGNIIYRHV
jgi:hypothetical protein